MTNSSVEIEETILLECKKKNKKYQEKLYKQFYGYALSVSLRYSNSREDAREITNDAFIKVFAAIERFDSKLSFKAWLRRIVINTSIDHYRKEIKHQNHLQIENPRVGELNCEAINQLAYEDVLKLLNKLPELHRITFNLYEIEGYSHDEVGEMLNIPASSSRVYLMRAKKRLRELFHKFYDVDSVEGRHTFEGIAEGQIERN